MPDLTALFSKALSNRTLSSVLYELKWLVGILIVGSILASRYGTLGWFAIGLGVLGLIVIVVFICVYIFFCKTNPDYLRSEKYSIDKMAITHGVYGDNRSGMKHVEIVGQQQLLENNKDQPPPALES
jgi:hypothetical protein